MCDEKKELAPGKVQALANTNVTTDNNNENVHKKSEVNKPEDDRNSTCNSNAHNSNESTNGQNVNNAKSVNNATGENGTLEQRLDLSRVPQIPVDVYKKLPAMLKNQCMLIDQPHSRDIFLVAALPVLAAHMPNAFAPHADKEYSPDLYTIVVADPGTGKGMAAKTKLLAMSLNRNLIQRSKDEIRKYNAQSDDYKKNATPPQPVSLFIPANSSVRAVYDQLNANNDSGLIHETEIDTLLNAFKQEWGNFSDLCRKAFHHEPASLGRKDGGISIDKPRLSIFMSGTPDQVKKMFHSAEDGHFSRYAFYTYNSDIKWQSHRPTEKSRKLELLIEEDSNKLYRLYEILSMREKPIYVNLTQEQWNYVDKTFENIMQYLDENEFQKHLHASNNRTALIALRMATILTVLRCFENDPALLRTAASLTPSDTDMLCAIQLAKVFIGHAVRIYQSLPTAEPCPKKSDLRKRFEESLSDEFTTQEAMEVANKIDISERTAKRWITQSFRKISHGLYSKLDT